MEFITIFLSSLISLVSPTGLVADAVIEDAIRDQLYDAEGVVVRLDATPTHQLLAGQIDKFRLAGRGLYPLEGVRIDTLDVETDPININVSETLDGNPELDEPVQALIRLVLTLEDLNQALQSPLVTDPLQDLSLNLLGDDTIGGLNRADVVRAEVTTVESGRLRLQALLQEQDTDNALDIQLEFGLRLASGHQIEILEPQLLANGERFPDDLLLALTDGISRELTLRSLEEDGLTLRLLKLEVEEDQIQIVAFARVEPSSNLLGQNSQVQEPDPRLASSLVQIWGRHPGEYN